MDAFQFKITFLVIFILGVAVEWMLHHLNVREIRKNQVIPANLSGLLGVPNPETYAKSQAYSLERESFAILSLLFSAGLTIAILFSGALFGLDRILLYLFGEGHTRSVFYLVILTAIPSLLKLPLSIYSIFRIEGKYGFNTMTWNLFWRDWAKQIFLAAALGIPLLYGFFFFIKRAGYYWWIWAFGIIMIFQVLMSIVYPIFIAPFFNRFKPLPEGELKSALLNLAQRMKFPAAEIYVMDGSLRSLHSNAYFMGMGKWRRIVLYDTLLHQLETREVLSVIAHEIGHYRLKHVYQQLFLNSFLLAAVLWLMSISLQWQPLYGAFGFKENAGAGIGVFLYLTCLSSLSVWLTPIQNLISRRFEYEADAYAVEACQDGKTMKLALIKLAEKNFSNWTPHPWYSAFYYSHPKLEDRLNAL